MDGGGSKGVPLVTVICKGARDPQDPGAVGSPWTHWLAQGGRSGPGPRLGNLLLGREAWRRGQHQSAVPKVPGSTGSSPCTPFHRGILVPRSPSS